MANILQPDPKLIGTWRSQLNMWHSQVPAESSSSSFRFIRLFVAWTALLEDEPAETAVFFFEAKKGPPKKTSQALKKHKSRMVFSPEKKKSWLLRLSQL